MRSVYAVNRPRTAARVHTRVTPVINGLCAQRVVHWHRTKCVYESVHGFRIRTRIIMTSETTSSLSWSVFTFERARLSRARRDRDFRRRVFLFFP